MRRTVLLVPLLLLLACDAASDDAASDAPGTAPGATSSASTAPAPTPGTAPPDPALADCPARVPSSPLRVPAPPTTETPGRLVPDADPVEALVCRYRPAGPDGAALDAPVLLQGGLERVRTDLDLPPGVAAPCDSEDRRPHLLRLRYADGELWLAALPGCPGATNGATTTAELVGDLLATAGALGTWPPSA